MNRKELICWFQELAAHCYQSAQEDLNNFEMFGSFWEDDMEHAAIYYRTARELMDSDPDRIANLERHIENMDLIVQDKLGETKLLRAGPGEDGFEIEMANGPIAILAEYMVQMMHHDPKNPLNFFEVEIRPKAKWDPMTITIQRRRGKTPGQLLSEANQKIEMLEKELLWRQTFIDNYELNSDYGDYKSFYEADGHPPEPSKD